MEEKLHRQELAGLGPSARPPLDADFVRCKYNDRNLRYLWMQGRPDFYRAIRPMDETEYPAESPSFFMLALPIGDFICRYIWHSTDPSHLATPVAG